MRRHDPSKIPYVSLVHGGGFYPYYKELCSQTAMRTERMIRSKSKADKVHNEIWKVIGEMYLEAEGGVYIDNVGYFCHIINPVRRPGYNHEGRLKSMRTNGYLYRHLVLDFKSYAQPYHIYKNLTEEITRKLKKMTPKKRYKLLLSEIKSHRKCNKPRKILTLKKKNFCSRFSASNGGAGV